jgi:queuine/archaeosine tRNA-ribosyltransferase
MKFDLLKKDPQSKARAGSITTDHGVIETPLFLMGTVASVKGTSKGLKEDINQILWETPIIYIYAHKWRSWRKPVVCINS